MTAAIGKLVMKSCTKLSLNERFTAYREQAESASATFRDKILSQRQGSAENRRLAQQMGNRPSVIAALRLKKKSMQQRLGQQRNFGAGNVKNRLNFNIHTPSKIQGRLGLRGRGRNATQVTRRNRGRPGFGRPGTSPMIKARLGMPFANNRKFSNRGFGKRKNFFNSNRQNQSVSVVNQFRRGAGRRRGQTRGRGGGNRGRGGWNRMKPVPTKQELDNQLDEYMSETKSTADLQLNQFM